MIAYEVRINGSHAATIGQEDMSILTAILTTSRGNQDQSIDDFIRLSLNGMSHETSEGYCQHFRWAVPDIEVGDKIEIHIVETNEVDAPTNRYRSDHQVQEDPFTEAEARELRYQDYLKFKAEFEPDGNS